MSRSMANEIWLRWELLQIVKVLTTAGAELAQELRPMFDHPTHAWDAASRSAPRASRELPGSAERKIDALAKRFGGLRRQAEHLASLAVQKNLGTVDARLSSAIMKSVRVDISPLLDASSAIGHKIVPAMREAAQQAADLITSIPERYLGRVRDAVTRSWQDGERWESLVADIEEIGHITERRARLIARDQTSKMNAAFNEVRQTSLGIEEYSWSGALDARERKSHVAMEASRQRWDSPPMVDGEAVHPGQAINCRCASIPIIRLDDLPSEMSEGGAA